MNCFHLKSTVASGRGFVCLVILGILLISSNVLAGSVVVDKRIRKGGFGIKGGFIYGTTIQAGGSKVETGLGFSGGVLFDFAVSSMAMVNLSMDMHAISPKNFTEKEPFLDISLGPKFNFYKEGSEVVFRPGASIGLGYLGPIGFLERTTYMTWRVYGEAMFLTHSNHAFLMELVVIGTAFGGNSEISVSSTPTFVIRGGIMY